jgi:hypothetical protein
MARTAGTNRRQPTSVGQIPLDYVGENRMDLSRSSALPGLAGCA